jgi:uncharacterized protein
MSPLDTAARQARLLDRIEHRPWPPPSGRWAVARTIEDVLAAHWRVSAGALLEHVPPGLELECRDGSAWLGLIAARVSAQRVRGLLPLPLSSLELHVRTYVTGPDGRPGALLLGLDTSSGLAAEAARRALGAAAGRARASALRDGEWTGYEFARAHEPGRVFSGRVRARGATFDAAPESLAGFFLERYAVYAAGRGGRLLRAELHHAPWRLRAADGEIALASIAPVALSGDPLCHAAARQDLLVWPLEPVR